MKIAFEKAFNTIENAYNYLSCDLFGRWCSEDNSGNYGVLCGYGGLFVLDFDDKETFMKVKKYMPPTMMVLSASKKLPHLYYRTTEDVDIKTVLFDNDQGNRIIDLQGLGKYVVGAGSQCDGKEYKLVNELPIATVSYTDMVLLLQNIFPNMKETKVKTGLGTGRWKRVYRDLDADVPRLKNSISMPQLLHHYGVDTTRRRTGCPHGHESNSGADLAFDEQLYYCHNCHKGGDIFELVMDKEGFSKKEFGKAIEWLKDTFKV